MRNFNTLQKRRKMTSVKQFIKLEWLHKGAMSMHLPHEGFKSVALHNVSTKRTVFVD